MMKCDKCGAISNVYDSRVTKRGVRRRRVCPNCGERWTTYELSQDRIEQISGELGKYRLIGQIIHDLFKEDAPCSM